jgi:hypothetical protein
MRARQADLRGAMVRECDGVPRPEVIKSFKKLHLNKGSGERVLRLMNEALGPSTKRATVADCILAGTQQMSHALSSYKERGQVMSMQAMDLVAIVVQGRNSLTADGQAVPSMSAVAKESSIAPKRLKRASDGLITTMMKKGQWIPFWRPSNQQSRRRRRRRAFVATLIRGGPLSWSSIQMSAALKVSKSEGLSVQR